MKSKRKKNKKYNRIKNTKKNKTNKKVKGGAIKGIGNDGCVIDSISCNELSSENGFVSKILYNNEVLNQDLHNRLEELDHDNNRYNRYYLPSIDIDLCEKKPDYEDDFQKCLENKHISKPNIVFQKLLFPLDETKMTKQQYRYLKESLNILHANNISHGDLIGNVMLNPNNNMPVIIDWEKARLNATETDKIIDNNAFFFHFKVKKII